MNRTIQFLKTYFLFGLQISLAWIFTVPQVIRSLTSTAGMTITWSLFCSVFVLINLFLAIGGYKQARVTKSGQLASAQLIIVYANWLVLWLAMLAVISVKGTWSNTDSLLSAIVCVSIMCVLALRRQQTLTETLSEPITRGIISVIVKSTPQLYIAYCIVHAGSNDGLAGATLLIGHLTVCIRIIEVLSAVMVKKDGKYNWSEHNIGLLISEVGNEVTWCVTTLVWFMY